MCHIFFIHSSVDGHLGCFHALAIVNRAAMNIVVHDSFWHQHLLNTQFCLRDQAKFLTSTKDTSSPKLWSVGSRPWLHIRITWAGNVTDAWIPPPKFWCHWPGCRFQPTVNPALKIQQLWNRTGGRQYSLGPRPHRQQVLKELKNWCTAEKKGLEMQKLTLNPVYLIIFTRARTPVLKFSSEPQTHNSGSSRKFLPHVLLPSKNTSMLLSSTGTTWNTQEWYWSCSPSCLPSPSPSQSRSGCGSCWLHSDSVTWAQVGLQVLPKLVFSSVKWGPCVTDLKGLLSGWTESDASATQPNVCTD